jgi:protein required for attachment to host cells
MESTWVLTAERASARVLERNRDSSAGYDVIEEIAHPEGRLRDGDIDTDRGGRFDRAAFGGNHGSSASETPHDHDAMRFARSLAGKLGQARAAGRFTRLVLAAEPRFLGMVREALDPVTARSVIGVLPKDLQHLKLADLHGHLSDLQTQ